MSRQLSTIAESWALPARRVLSCAAAVLALAVPAVAQSGPDVMRVEEDWRLVLNEPDDGTYSPQFHTVMSPFPHLTSFYSQVTWNYKEENEFLAGGLQFQNWVNGEIQRAVNFRTESLSTSAETITWTQRLKVSNSLVRFYVVHGQSTTWGEFGNYILDANVGVANLNQYDSATSVQNSWITYGSNRVDSLVITEVRRYDASDNLVSIDDTPKVVFQLEDGEEAE